MSSFFRRFPLMKSLSGALCLSLGLKGTLAFGYGLGVTSHPFPQPTSLLTTEFVNHMSNGKGLGLQARLTRKLNSTVSLEGGAGFADSNRAGRFFAAMDVEFFPDYEKQPRLSLKTFVENAREFGRRNTILGVSPVASKGFLLWDHEVYPFAGVPVAIGLNDINNSYQARAHMSLGMTTKFPLGGYDHLLVNFEGDINITNSFTGFFLGLTYPLTN